MNALAEFRERLDRDTGELEAAGLLKRELLIDGPQGPEVTPRRRNGDVQSLRQQLSRPRESSCRARGRSPGARPLRLRRRIGALHLRHAERAPRTGRAARALPAAWRIAILYSSCFDANGGLFETCSANEDAVISDALNHASIIDGIRLCKARRLRYANNDMDELGARPRGFTADARVRLIATDGVFSMDGSIARLDEICDPRGPARRPGHGR